MNNCLREHCSFNSFKGLLYKDYLDSYAKGIILPPVEVNLDIVNNCQLHCVWCNSSKVIDRNNVSMMNTEHLLDLCRFFKQWGVKAVCFAGGGESTMHPDLDKALKELHDLGLESALITNGLFLDDKQIKSVAKYCRWIGVSVDASNKHTYKRCKGKDEFDKVISNIEKLVSHNPKELTYKFLIHPFNQFEILQATELAKKIGCNAIHIRPLSDAYLAPLKLDKTSIGFGMKESLLHHSDIFKVWDMFHKSNENYSAKINFKRCMVSPLLAMFEANGDINLCIDRKGDSKLKLCSHNNIEDIKANWGSQRHKDILDSITPSVECPKCTLTIYQELYESLQEDKFCRNFP